MRRILVVRLILIALLTLTILPRSSLAPADAEEKVRAFTRSIEFEYITWVLNALWVKVSQASLGANRYLAPQAQQLVIAQYLSLIQQKNQIDARISGIYSDPGVSQPGEKSAGLRNSLGQLQRKLRVVAPLAETILQAQVSQVLASDRLASAGETLPPVWFHATPLPLALIISPRDAIRTDQDISLLPDLTIEQMDALEDEVSRRLNVSALVVPVGGIGIYPTMVMQADDLNWLSTVISHEWTHNYLTLRPLGLNYDSSPDLRTMNETAASITGNEIGAIVMEEYYPALVPQPEAQNPAPSPGGVQKPAFNFREEMHATRVKVDRLLKEGKIEEAEAYMNARRSVFFAHGYQIRRLNQAYFAFYGAYEDIPGGAAGEDPVGPAVRALRQKSGNLANFLNRISWMTSFTQLQEAVRPP